MAKRVMILAGGTGGHVYPALSVAQDLLASGHEVFWVGSSHGLEARVVPAAGIPHRWMRVSGIRGKGWSGRLRAPLMLVRALLESLSIVREARPDVVLGMGGYVSGPGSLVARLCGIPLVIHEQNRVPGTTNSLLSRIASSRLQAFPESFQAGVGAITVGNPLRASIEQAASRARPVGGDGGLRILVLGGSLGAQRLNEVVPVALSRLAQPFRVLHQTGRIMRDETEALYASLGICADVVEFVEDMAEAYAGADIAVCRAGAMTVSELAMMGLPSVLVPYPFAIDDHQTQNARYLSERGAAVLLPQSELTPDGLETILKRLVSDTGRLEAMAGHARKAAFPGSAGLVASICLGHAVAKSQQVKQK